MATNIVVRKARGVVRRVKQLGNASTANVKPIELWIDSPAETERVRTNVLTIEGWAFSRVGAITRIAVFLDKNELGELAYGMPRSDVRVAFRLPGENCGFFGVMDLAEDIPGGQYCLRVVATDDQGHTRTLQRQIFLTDSRRVAIEDTLLTLPMFQQAISHPAPFVNTVELGMGPTKIRTKQEYIDLQQTLGNAGQMLEAALIENGRKKRRVDLIGYCEACEQISLFSAPWSPEESGPNLRESLRCHRCGLWSRVRKVAGYTKATRRADKRDIYLYEQVTAFYSWMRNTFADANVIGSEYLGDGIPGGTIVDGVRHEDALALSFADASIDYIISCEVFEHVPDIRKTLSEASRVLRPGGQLIMTIPFYTSEDITVQRATLKDGKLTHHLPPVYHGNPLLLEEGSLVFFDYGWDFITMCRDAGFKDTYMLPYFSLWQAHIGPGVQGIFVAEK